MAEAYPLTWPEGWPRTPQGKRDGGSRFKTGTGFEYDATAVSGQRYVGKKVISFDRARRLLADELERLGVANVVLSTNIPLRLDGQPHAGAARLHMDDPGVAIYFTFKGKQMVMAQDVFTNVAANMRSLSLAIEAMRQLERHGGGRMMERAFAGFVAIAPPGWKKPWRQVFGVKPEWSGNVKALYKTKAKERHPDFGGHDTLMAELNVAYEEAKAELSQ